MFCVYRCRSFGYHDPMAPGGKDPETGREAPVCVFCQQEIDLRRGATVHAATDDESCYPDKDEFPKAYPSLRQMWGIPRDSGV
jgi:hypothetical protein